MIVDELAPRPVPVGLNAGAQGGRAALLDATHANAPTARAHHKERTEGSAVDRHGISHGRIDLSLLPEERHAGLTVNEYETLLMRHDLREVLENWKDWKRED